jgi:hypothetical protein
MEIAYAIQKGSTVHVYNQKNGLMFMTPVGNGPNDGLQGYTSSHVSIRKGNTIWIYNNKGGMTGMNPVK